MSEHSRPDQALLLAPPAPRKSPASCTARAIKELSCRPVAGPAHVMDWFPGLDGYDPSDQLTLGEEVQPLGQHGRLTLVYHLAAAPE